MSNERLYNFNEIYTTYYQRSYLYVNSYIHDEMAAEDIVSDALIRLWERMKEEEIGSVKAFLFTILKNNALDFLKHQAVKRNVHGALELVLARELEIRRNSLESSDPREIFSNEIHQIMEATLQLLPDKTRQVFIMSRFENKSHKEIAELLGISIKGVEYHIAQSIKALRSALKDYLSLLIFFPFLNN